ncbi:PepSY domain-containing protein [Paenisporosarcina antarctica]|uniref:PepSY domain-containing protein n=1 Tax=Paenisporosarcina antarctica TaxID=417367 RepID=A0A4P6ZZG4_9BACL|nr:PepSY domain-containing protein [Paenisporosarcina antarctica]QBP41648.1 hypothetical protein E2636_11050 [Paenisporosarcina antarctica]
MTFFTKKWFIPLLLTIIIVGGGAVYMWKLTSEEEIVTKEEIQSRIEQMYGDSISNLIRKNDRYIAQINRRDGLYEIVADTSKGDIISITLLEQATKQQLPIKTKEDIQSIVSREYEGTIERMVLSSEMEQPFYAVDIAKDETLITLTIDAVTGSILDSKKKQTTAEQALISKDQAIIKANTQLTGEVQYITYEETSDGGYYLIEIESEDDREAVIQVHGVSGEILSVTWDDQDDDDDDSDDD